MTLEQPILVNMNNYAILVKTPDGKFINMAGNSRVAVAGPGFETYIEKRILTPVGDYRGPVIFESHALPPGESVTFPKPPEPAVVEKAPLPPQLPYKRFEAKEAPTVEEIGFGPATADGSPLPMPVTVLPPVVSVVQPPPPAPTVTLRPEEVTPAKTISGLPVGAPTLPSKSRLQAMKHKDLVEVATRLKLKTDGWSRGQILARLLPLARD